MGQQGLTGNQSLFKSPSLCPYYIMLWSKCNRLHELGNLTNFYISSGITKVKKTKISSTHTKDFTKYFPEIDLLPTLLKNMVALFKFWKVLSVSAPIMRRLCGVSLCWKTPEKCNWKNATSSFKVSMKIRTPLCRYSRNFLKACLWVIFIM